ncbi:hypothetical protein [Bartonella sp. A05]|uniref:hypothetical protein n=1 Tax=Bartonella sp. A05 TaxID=2967261 RepID=UPI0022A8F21D|nr:hypothetical protein [Bartonella sp. A05]MCZ2203604.1 hypothetical protein [Bartonella sp. A05]
MKKLILTTTVMAIILGTPNLALATIFPRANHDITANWWGSGQRSQTNYHPPAPPKQPGKGKIFNIHADHDNLFLQDAQSLFNDGKTKRAVTDPRVPLSESIERIIQADKDMSMKTISNAEERHKHLNTMLKDAESKLAQGSTNMEDLVKLQLQMDSELALIQNEVAKLQMVVQLRNAEQALIDQQKRKRNQKILSSSNRGMPRITDYRSRIETLRFNQLSDD